jgi:hypothetical protein
MDDEAEEGGMDEGDGERGADGVDIGSEYDCGVENGRRDRLEGGVRLREASST